jgi:hypothetical protein
MDVEKKINNNISVLNVKSDIAKKSNSLVLPNATNNKVSPETSKEREASTSQQPRVISEKASALLFSFQEQLKTAITKESILQKWKDNKLAASSTRNSIFDLPLTKEDTDKAFDINSPVLITFHGIKFNQEISEKTADLIVTIDANAPKDMNDDKWADYMIDSLHRIVLFKEGSLRQAELSYLDKSAPNDKTKYSDLLKRDIFYGHLTDQEYYKQVIMPSVQKAKESELKACEQTTIDRIYKNAGEHLQFVNPQERKTALLDIKRMHPGLELLDIKALEEYFNKVTTTKLTTEENAELTNKLILDSRKRDLDRLSAINNARQQELVDIWDKQGLLGVTAEGMKGTVNYVSDFFTYLAGGGNADDYMSAHWFKTIPDAAREIVKEVAEVTKVINSLRANMNNLTPEEFNARYKAIRGEDVLFDRYLDWANVWQKETYVCARLSSQYGKSNKYLDGYVVSQEIFESSAKFIGTAMAFSAVVGSGGSLLLILPAAGASFATGVGMDVADASIKKDGITELDIKKSLIDNGILTAQHATFNVTTRGTRAILSSSTLTNVSAQASTASQKTFHKIAERGIDAASVSAGFTAFGATRQIGYHYAYGTPINFSELSREAKLGAVIGAFGPFGGLALIAESGYSAPAEEKVDVMVTTAGLVMALSLDYKGIRKPRK